jgi:hypothetical protein
MKKLILAFISLVLLNLILPYVILKIVDKRFTYSDTNTEANLFVIPAGKHVGVLLMGTSHGKIYSRSGNHLRVEHILGRSMVNIAKSEGGIIPEEVFLEYFINKKNTAGTVIYFIDPYVFYSDKWNEKNYFLNNEPLTVALLPILAKKHIDSDVLINYAKAKFTLSYLQKTPSVINTGGESITHIDPEAVKKRLANLYPDGTDNHQFTKYAGTLEKEVRIMQKNHMRIIFIIPPSLLGKTPGEKKVVQLLKQFKNKYNISYTDCSQCITDPKLYYDHDHLNTNGVVFFTTRYLKKFFK